MNKQTTGEVAKALRISKDRIYSTLFNHPELRPRERLGKQKLFLWSAEEITAFQAYLLAHAHKPHHKSSARVR